MLMCQSYCHPSSTIFIYSPIMPERDQRFRSNKILISYCANLAVCPNQRYDQSLLTLSGQERIASIFMFDRNFWISICLYLLRQHPQCTEQAYIFYPYGLRDLLTIFILSFSFWTFIYHLHEYGGSINGFLAKIIHYLCIGWWREIFETQLIS